MKFALTLSLVMVAFIAFIGSISAAENKSSFDFLLYQQVAKEKSKSNVLISPFSVSTALSMTYSGAKGETKKALAEVLGFAGSSDEAVQQESKEILDSLRNPGGDTKLEIANTLFGEKSIKFKEPFLAANKKYFDADIQSLDFKAPESVTKINSWVSDKTHGKIPTILDKIGDDAILYLINAIYFKGTWANKFEKEQTETADFHTASGGTKKVQMMNSDRDDFRYVENEDFQAVTLPYADKRLSLYVFLPKENKSLDAFEASLNQENWDRWMMLFRKRDGHVGLPRFKIEDKMELKQPLSEIGLAVAFDQGKADFAEMAEVDQRIYISRVIHKTFMEVNEEGTEAAAVTAIEMSTTSAMVNPTPPFRMIMDRPFFIALRDNKTGKILFAGHIAEPQ